MTPSPAAQPDPSSSPLDLETFRQVPTQTGVEIDSLGASLADRLSKGADPYETAAPARDEAATGEASDEQATEEPCEVTPRTILEALLFVGSPGNEPLSSEQAAAQMRGVRPAEIDALVRELNDDYRRRNCPYAVVHEGAGYRMTLHDEFARIRDQFQGKARQARLSQAAIEVLAIVAYQAPVSGDEIARLRGKPSGHILTNLVRRQLLRLERAPGKRGKARYSTTERFLSLFHLKSLQELPRSEDLEG